jgi:CBS domain-containing protein
MANTFSAVDQVDLIKCGDICHSKDLTSINGQATLQEAWELMNKKNVTCLPVMKGNQIVGLIDIRMLSFFVVFDLWKRPENSSAKVKLDNTEALKNVKVADILPAFPESNQLWKFAASDPIHKLIEAFSKGVHRAIIDNAGFCRLVTQTDVTDWVLNNRAFNHILDREVGTLNFKKPKIVHMHEMDPALRGFEQLSIAETGSVAVLRKDGTLAGNLSASDLKGLQPSTLYKLESPVSDFLKETHPSSLTPAVVKSQDTLRTVLHMMINSRIHRVWFVDQSQKPEGCISMSDVMAKFVRYAPEMQYSSSSYA